MSNFIYLPKYLYNFYRFAGQHNILSFLIKLHFSKDFFLLNSNNSIYITPCWSLFSFDVMDTNYVIQYRLHSRVKWWNLVLSIVIYWQVDIRSNLLIMVQTFWDFRTFFGALKLVFHSIVKLWDILNEIDVYT